MTSKHIPRSVGVHDGTFHADEVTACALLILFDLVDKDKVLRSRVPEKLAECEFVCDVGGIYDPLQKLFDHHQSDYQGPWSSAGMVLRWLKDEKILTDDDYRFFNGTLIIGVDDHDNGRDPMRKGYCTFSHVVSNFSPTRRDVTPKDLDQAFHKALDFVLGHLGRSWDRRQYIKSCKNAVQQRMLPDAEYLVFDENIPWMEGFFELGGEDHPALFVIMPSGEHWKLRGIPPSMADSMNVRLPLPAEWAGLLEGDLQKATGMTGAIFCHKGRFISVWETKEDALQALKIVMEKVKDSR